MLGTPKLHYGHTWIMPCTTSDDHQRDAMSTNMVGLTLPPSNSPLDSPYLFSGIQAKQTPQPSSGIPSKRKNKGYSDLNFIPPQESHGLCPKYHTQMTTKPMLQHMHTIAKPTTTHLIAQRKRSNIFSKEKRG